MAKIDELTERLLRRFRDVPNIDEDDAKAWIELSMNEHGFDSQVDVPLEYISIVMLYAEADAAFQIALKTAHYFEYRDKDESVDKTKVADQYRKLAEALWDRYKIKRSEGVGDVGGSQFHIMQRVDRP